jgi:hypothetical protein
MAGNRYGVLRTGTVKVNRCSRQASKACAVVLVIGSRRLAGCRNGHRGHLDYRSQLLAPFQATLPHCGRRQPRT